MGQRRNGRRCAPISDPPDCWLCGRGGKHLVRVGNPEHRLWACSTRLKCLLHAFVRSYHMHGEPLPWECGNTLMQPPHNYEETQVRLEAEAAVDRLMQEDDWRVITDPMLCAKLQGKD
jgi:hypothetical protein